VFEASSDGEVRPVYHAYVSMAAPPRSLDLPEIQSALATPSRNAGLAAVTLESPEGAALFRTVVDVPRWVRGEFQGATPHSQIDGHILPLERSYIVVRAPVAGDGGGFRIQTAGGLDASVSLAALTAVTRPAPPARASISGAVTGDPANRVDLLIMGDGYTAAEESLFQSNAASTAAAFFGITPYAEYENFVNIHTLFTASPQSGADHPPYNAACGTLDPSCCADSLALADPLAGTYVDTAFGARFCYYNLHRLMDVDELAVYAAAAAVPDWDHILVIVNDTTYGGAGGIVAVASMSPQSVPLIQHEFGHSFTDLADEYDDPYPSYPACSDLYGPACEANVTDVTARNDIKWAAWIEPWTAVPTAESPFLANDQTVGLFEGARYLSTGMYRPGDWCMMRVLGQSFCPVPTQAYILRLYNGGWGVPWAGIDTIEPGSEDPPPGPVDATLPGGVSISVELLEPSGGPPLEIEWRVDGALQPGETAPAFLFAPPGPGTYEVRLDVTDPTALVHPDMAGGALRHSRSWTVTLTGAAATPTPTPVPSIINHTPPPTPTAPATAGPALTQGDVDCDLDVDSVDALKQLRHVAGMSVSQEPVCPQIGAEVASLFGDVDCDGDVDSVDALKVLRHVAGLWVTQAEPCPDIGTSV
jgi:hypothetical protein